MSNQLTTFVLSDETVKNTFNFRVAHAGLNLARFKNNPVMLDGHQNDNRAVIGRWLNPRLEGGQLKAEADFDLHDPAAEAIHGKVKRGFIKGASIGLIFDPFHLKALPNNDLVLEQAEVLEASICPVPSNGNAISLFNNKGQLLDETAVKQLCLSAQHNPLITNFTKTELSGNENKIILDAVEAGIITADVFEKMPLSLQIAFKRDNPKAYQALFESDSKSKANFKIQNYSVKDGFIGEPTTLNEFEKLPLNKQLAFKREKPEAYKLMFK